MEERLQKILASYGLGARRKCEEMINEGIVEVNGVRAVIGQKADVSKDTITVAGEPIVSSNKRLVYILLNKPAGYICTKSDPHAEKTIMELVKSVKYPVFPVGRLDKNTRGLILLTNDGNFANVISHPSYETDKKYLAYCLGKISKELIAQIERGVVVEGKKTSPCEIIFRGYNKTKDLSCLDVIIHEGRKRQIRKMFASIERPIKQLTRTELSFLTLKGVKEGTFRFLSKDEVQRLLNIQKEK